MVAFFSSDDASSHEQPPRLLKYEAGAQLRSVVQAMVATRIVEQTREKLSSLPSRKDLREHVRVITTSRLEQTREKLLLLPSPKKIQDHVLEQTREKLCLMAAKPRMLQDHVFEQTREKLSLLPSPKNLQDQVIGMTMENVRAVSIGALGILERIDIMLAPDISSLGALKNSSEDDDDENFKVTSLPRSLSVQVMRTFSVQLSKSATLRVTVLCMADTCTSVLRQLRVADKQELLRRLHLVDVQQIASNVGVFSSALVARAKRVHPYLDWALSKLGDRLAVRIFGNAAAEVGAKIGMEVSSAEAKAHVEATAGLQMPEVQDYSYQREELDDIVETSHEPMMGVVTEFQLIVKNSFIEFADDTPDLGSPMFNVERSRSLPDLSSWFAEQRQDHARGTSEPYTVKLSCVENISPKDNGSIASSAQQQQQPQQQPQQQLCQQQQVQQQQIAWVSAPHQANGFGPPLQCPQSFAAPWQAPLPLLACSPLTTPRDTPAFLSPAPAPYLQLAPTVAPEPMPLPTDATTTVLLRALPLEYTRTMLLELLDSFGFFGKYNFVYLPIDFSRAKPLGYALVCCYEYSQAQEMIEAMEGFCNWGSIASDSVCSASWSEPHQGLEAHVDRYRNSPVMHHSVPDHYKPLVFELGRRAPFPAPTKSIRAPRVRHLKPGSE